MKKILLILFALCTMQGYSQVAQNTVTFNFNDPTSLNVTPKMVIPAGTGQVYALCNATRSSIITDGPVQISFEPGVRKLGAGIHNYASSTEDPANYNLRILDSGVMTISSTDGSIINSIEFTGYLGDLTLKTWESGSFNTTRKIWNCGDSQPTSVTFNNGSESTNIYTIKVTYTRPATPLNFSSSSPADGSQVETFSSLTVYFNTSLTSVNSDITIEGPAFSSPQKMTAYISGSTLSLSINPTITKDGTYTITIPANALTNTDGAKNTSAIVLQVVVYATRTIINYTGVDPATGEYGSLPQEITLSFADDVLVDETKTGVMKLNGSTKYPVTFRSADSKNKVIISNSHGTITELGTWTIDVPEGVIHNSFFGASDEFDRWNPAFTLTYQVIEVDRATLERTGVDPAEGTYNTLPQEITLSFADDVLVDESKTGMMKLNGTGKYPVTFSLADDKTKVIVTNSHGEITDIGTWTIDIPEGAIHNSFYGTSDAEDRWNPAFTLSYTLEKKVLPEMKEAQELLAQSGVGYPADGSAGRRALAAAISKGDAATADELNEAMAAFKAETNVTMPAANAWYKIAGVNTAGTYVYLSYADGKVGLTSSPSAAGAFKLTQNSGSYIFETNDGKFLHVLTTANDYVGTTSDNVTSSESDVRNLTLQVLTVNNAPVFGLFTIYGSLGYKGGVEYKAYSTINISNAAITTTADNQPQYTATNSSAFTFVTTTEPVDPSLTVTPEVKVDGASSIAAGEQLKIMILNVDQATIKDNSKPFFNKDGQKVSFSGTILSATNTRNGFAVNTTGLASGDYVLNLPVGTFDYVAEGKTVVDGLMTVDFTITGSPVVPVTGVTLDSETASVAVGKTVTLSATVAPADASNKTVTWKSDKESVATVKNGVVTGVAAGTATITVTTEDGQKTANCTVTVTSTEVLPTGVTLNSSTATVNIGSTVTLTATVAPSNATDKTVTWTSSSTSIAKVENGVVTGVAAGTATITAKTVNGKTATCTVTVQDPSDDFKYDYYRSAIIPLQGNIIRKEDFIRDVDLNDLILFTYKNNPFTDMIPDPTKKVIVTSTYGYSPIAEGHFEKYTGMKQYESALGVKASEVAAIKLVLDTPIKAGDLDYKEALYCYIIPAATFGDANFGKYLSNTKGIKKSDCIVNAYIGSGSIQFQVDNIKAGIKEVSADDPSKNEYYDLSGRKISKPTKKGVYIINGRKVLK